MFTVDRSHPAFVQPQSDTTVWRYMDHPRLLDLLLHSRLYTRRLADLQDKWEGWLAPSVRTSMRTHWERELSSQKNIPQMGPDFLGASMVDWARYSTYVSCWCRLDHELDSMWKTYGGQYSVALRTSYDKLCESISVADMHGGLFAGSVRYMDVPTISAPEYIQALGNSQDQVVANHLHLATIKRLEYATEHEVRIVAWTFDVAPASSRKNGDIDIKNQSSDFYVDVDLSSLGAEIVISPYASDWYRDLLTELVTRLGLEFPVVRSSMAQTPPTA